MDCMSWEITMYVCMWEFVCTPIEPIEYYKECQVYQESPFIN